MDVGGGDTVLTPGKRQAWSRVDSVQGLQEDWLVCAGQPGTRLGCTSVYLPLWTKTVLPLSPNQDTQQRLGTFLGVPGVHTWVCYWHLVCRHQKCSTPYSVHTAAPTTRNDLLHMSTVPRWRNPFLSGKEKIRERVCYLERTGRLSFYLRQVVGGSPFQTSIRSYPFVDEEGGFVQRAAFHFLLLSKHQTEYVGCCGSRTSRTLACGKGMDRLHTNWRALAPWAQVFAGDDFSIHGSLILVIFSLHRSFPYSTQKIMPVLVMPSNVVIILT